MNDERLGKLGVLAMQGFSFPLNVEQICKEFVTKHSRKCVPQVLIYVVSMSTFTIAINALICMCK